MQDIIDTHLAECDAAVAAIALTREDLYHAADGVGAVETRARAAHDLDALYLIDRQLFFIAVVFQKIITKPMRE